jgi:hypothetical protein
MVVGMPTDSFAAVPPLAPAPEVSAPVRVPSEVRLHVRSRGHDVAVGAAVAGGLLALTLVSLWFRTRALHVHYWVDEGLSVGIAGHPLSAIPGLLREDGSPPLYYLLLHLWMAWRGTGEVATHELSLIFALLTIPAAYWVGTSVFDRRAGVVCAIIAALAPYLTMYAQETRMYSLMALLSLLVAGTFVQAFVHRRRWYVLVFAVTLAGALYTHNWALFLTAIALVAFAWCVLETPAGERRGLVRDGLLGFGGAALLFAPWLPTVIYQARHTGAPWALPPSLWSLSEGTYFLVGSRGAAVAILLAGGSGLLAVRAAERSVRAEGRGMRAKHVLAAEALLVLGIGTLLLAWLVSRITPAWAPRYLAVIVGPLLLVAAFGLSRAGRLGVCALALACSFWMLDPVPTTANSKSDVAAAVRHVRDVLTPGTLVLSTQPEQVPTLAFYMPAGMRFATPLGAVSDPRVVDWRDALTTFRRSSVASVLMPLLRSVAPGQRVALVTPLNLATRPLWMELINRTSRRWTRVLKEDPQFRRIAFSSPQTVTSLAVRIVVYLRRA